jgi:hypothetical protein
MSTIQIDSLSFTFRPEISATRYDTSPHYIHVWQQQNQRKAVDVIALETEAAPATMWLIEAKDFRVITQPPKPSNVAGSAQTVARKVEDTIAGLEHAASHAADPEERNYESSAAQATG